jgi:7-dehydrocholesterol reductase
MTFCPILVTSVWITLEHLDGSIFAALTTLAGSPEGFLVAGSRYLPQWDSKVTLAYAGWILFQAALYTFLPGTIGEGQRTPAGHKLEYKLNGLLAWIVTIATTVIASAAGWIDPAILAKNWENMICTLNLFGLLVSLAFYVKARVYPSHARDRKFSGKKSACASRPESSPIVPPMYLFAAVRFASSQGPCFMTCTWGSN